MAHFLHGTDTGFGGFALEGFFLSVLRGVALGIQELLPLTEQLCNSGFHKQLVVLLNHGCVYRLGSPENHVEVDAQYTDRRRVFGGRGALRFN